jgi:hypothetical protein
MGETASAHRVCLAVRCSFSLYLFL